MSAARSDSSQGGPRFWTRLAVFVGIYFVLVAGVTASLLRPLGVV